MASSTTPTTATAPQTSSLSSKLAATERGAALDVAFVLDVTGSMQSYITAAQQSIRSIAEEIVAAENADVRFALVAYRDHPPQDTSFVTQVTDFTSMSKVKAALDGCRANGGGDGPEAVAAALFDAYKTISWRAEATKICVLICDAPPHGLAGNSGDGFPNGCPLGNDPVDLAHKMAEAGITLYTVGCEPSINQYRSFFMGLCEITGGQYSPMGSAAHLAGMVTAAASEEINLEKMMAAVDAEVKATGAAMTEEAQTAMVYDRLKGQKAKKVKRGDAELPEADAQARAIASTRSLSACNSVYKAAAPDMGDGGGYAPAMMMASASAPAPRRSFLGRLGFGAKSAAAPPPPPMAYSSAPMMSMDFAAASSTSASGGGAYCSVEEEVSPAQAARMVKKSRARNGFSKVE